MSRITAISKYGFKLDTSDDWLKCDRNLINDKKFKELKKNTLLKGITTNKCGFVIDFIILEQGGDVSVSTRQISPLNPSCKSLGLEHDKEAMNPQRCSSNLSVQDKITYGQCVNLAFHSLGEINLDFENGFWIKKGFDIADMLYEEYVERCRR